MCFPLLWLWFLPSLLPPVPHSYKVCLAFFCVSLSHLVTCIPWIHADNPKYNEVFLYSGALKRQIQWDFFHLNKDLFGVTQSSAPSSFKCFLSLSTVSLCTHSTPETGKWLSLYCYLSTVSLLQGCVVLEQIRHRKGKTLWTLNSWWSTRNIFDLSYYLINQNINIHHSFYRQWNILACRYAFRLDHRIMAHDQHYHYHHHPPHHFISKISHALWGVQCFTKGHFCRRPIFWDILVLLTFCLQLFALQEAASPETLAVSGIDG